MKTTYNYEDGIKSKRLTTRFLTAADYLLWTEFLSDKEATQFLPTFGLSSPLERAKYWIELQLYRYQEKQFGLQALIENGTNEFIGQCGLVKHEVDGKAKIEVGYHIFKKYWGQGYATEAAKAFINYAFENNVANTIISIIRVGNIKSQRVADKSGLVKEKQMKWAGQDVFIYRIKKQIETGT